MNKSEVRGMKIKLTQMLKSVTLENLSDISGYDYELFNYIETRKTILCLQLCMA